MTRSKSGFTLLETLFTVVILGVIIVAFVLNFSQNTPFYHRTQIRQGIMLNSRMAMDTILDRLRNGRGRTLHISTPASVPFVNNSRVDFVLQTELPSGATAYAIYLDPTSNTVYTQEWTLSPPAATPGQQPPRVLATGVTDLSFTGDSRDPAFVKVSLRLDIPWDGSGDPTHVSTIILPDEVVHMVESP